MGITDQLLMAYVDGELAPDLAALILSRLETEPDLLERMEQHQQLRRRLSATYSPIMGEPLPPRLAELLAKENARAASWQSRLSPGSAFRRVGEAWPIWAMAAATLVGVGLSEFRHVADPLARSADGKTIAAGPLAQSLEHGLAAEAPVSGAKIMASFEDRGGRYCRVFQAAGDGHQDGVACKNDGRWLVVALATSASPAPSAGYRQASSALSPSIAAAVDDLQGATVLTPGQERQARTQQWQVRGKTGAKRF